MDLANFERMTEEFAIYMNYVRKLGFEETPDYDFRLHCFEPRWCDTVLCFYSLANLVSLVTAPQDLYLGDVISRQLDFSTPCTLVSTAERGTKVHMYPAGRVTHTITQMSYRKNRKQRRSQAFPEDEENVIEQLPVVEVTPEQEQEPRGPEDAVDAADATSDKEREV
ncbi:hypothetical protein BKA93DRAFT_882741 [Sparassis latifolia]